MDIVENKLKPNGLKEYDPDEAITITLERKQWETVRHWLLCGRDYHKCKMHEALANCNDKRLAAEHAGEHENAAAEAEQLYKIMESILCPLPPTDE